jgi:hypothetical protein
VRIEGTPGTGKTQLVELYRKRLQTVGITRGIFQRLVSRDPEPDPIGAELGQVLHGRLDEEGLRIVPYHRLLRETDSALPATVVQSLAVQVEAAVPEARLPQYETSLHRLSAVLDRAQPILSAAKKRLVLAIDGIDRFEGDDAADSLADLLPAALTGITVICSARPVHDDLAFMESESFVRIDLDDTASRVEACRRLAIELLPRVPTPIDVEQAIAVSHANPRYLRDLLHQLIERPRAPLDRVPYAFRAYLEQLWDEISGSAVDRDSLLTGLGILCRSGADPMTVAEIAEQAGWDGVSDSRSTAFLRQARAVLLEAGPEPRKYSPFVPSFAEIVRRKLIDERDAPKADEAIAVASSVSRGLGFGFAAALTMPTFGGSADVQAPPAQVVEALVTPPAAAPGGGRGVSTGSPLAPAAKPTFTTGRTSAWYALLVGVDAFVESELSLKYCVNDVQALQAALIPLRYAVSTLHDQQTDLRLRPTLLNIRAALAGLKARFDPEALLWVHFSTHGMLLDGRPTVLAADSRRNDPTGSMLTVDAILEAMRQSGARRRFLSLDACHAGVSLGRDAGAPVGLDPASIHNAFDLGEGEYIFSSCTIEQDAQDWAQRQLGVATAFMVDGLSGKADTTGLGIVTADQLRDYVVEGVRSWTFSHQKQLQTPTAESRVDGELILADRRQVP